MTRIVSKVIAKSWPKAAEPLLSTLEELRGHGPSAHQSHYRWERRRKEIQAEATRLYGSADRRLLVTRKLHKACCRPPVSISVAFFQTEGHRAEFARELTFFASKLYCNVIPEDLLEHLTHNDCDCATKSGLKSVAAYFDALAVWVSRSILARPKAKQRAQAFEALLSLAAVSWFYLLGLTFPDHGLPHTN